MTKQPKISQKWCSAEKQLTLHHLYFSELDLLIEKLNHSCRSVLLRSPVQIGAGKREQSPESHSATHEPYSKSIFRGDIQTHYCTSTDGISPDIRAILNEHFHPCKLVSEVAISEEAFCTRTPGIRASRRGTLSGS